VVEKVDVEAYPHILYPHPVNHHS